MKGQDIFLAALVIVIWGMNFLFIHFALSEVSPLVLGILRFLLVLFPAIFIVRKPDIPWYWLVAYGFFISFCQFSLLFGAIAMGLSTGLAALLLQSQAFFTILIAAMLWHETIRPCQWLAMLIALIGLGLIGLGQNDTHIPLMGLVLILSSAISWSIGNAVVKFIGPTQPMPLVIWGNVISLILFTLVACGYLGAGEVVQQIRSVNWQGWLAVAYLSYGATFIGYGVWGLLLSRYPATKIAPLTLLIPIVAIVIACVFLHESFNGWQWGGGVVIMAALVVQLFAPRFFKWA